jgi:hypothetical protein
VEAKLGSDPDDYTDKTASAWCEAADELFATEPTTLAGMPALLRFADDLGEDRSLVE